MSPIIGIVSCGLIDERQFVTQTYIKTIESAGGIPVIIPCITDSAAYYHYSNLCDGFLFCGGDDITPWLFGEELVTSCGKTDSQTDMFHLSFMEYLLSTKLPILGICRGMQLLNIALGGTIYQDIKLRGELSINHMQLSGKRSDVSHKVVFSKNSLLYNICGNCEFTNTFHHQCIKALGNDLRITGITSDGIVEALESIAHPFVVGVQWHPECMYESFSSMRKLFEEFIKFSSNAKIIQLA